MNWAALLVEDDRDDALLMQHAWDKANMNLRLQVVNGGDEALDYFQGRGPFANREEFPLPRLVLLDLRLQGRSGFDVLRWLRENINLRSTIVIILSASSQAVDVAQAYALGANSYLVKPTSLGLLVEMLQDLRRYWCKWNIYAGQNAELALA